MKQSFINQFDVKFHFKQNKKFYIYFSIAGIIGIVLGIIISFVSDSYSNLLTSSNKLIYSMMNGTIDSSVLFWDKFFVFVIPIILFFIFSLNYYLSFFQLLIFIYQATLLILSCSALILTYGFSGVINVLFVTLPINLCYFASLIFCGVTNMARSEQALKYKNFTEGFDEIYLIKTLMVMVFILFICFIACVVYPIILQNVNFIIF